MTKFFSTISILLIFSSFVKTQTVDTLSHNKTEFLDGLSKQFATTKRPELNELAKEFSNLVSQGKISDDVLKNIIKTSNKILLMRGKAYPQLQSVIKSYMDLSSIPLSSGEWTDFNSTLDKVILNVKKGDTKSIIDFIEFSYPLYKENALFYSKAKIWSVSNKNFKLSYSENGPIVTVSNTDIKGKTTGDSLLVLNTSGVFNYTTSKWNGDKGGANWERAGLPASDVYVSLKDYEINMSTQQYVVEKAIFTYKNYLERPIEGQFEDKIVSKANIETTKYPQFIAKKEDVPAQEITKNVKYYGGFVLAGSKVLGGSDGEKSELIIYKPNSTEKILTAITSSITINLPEKISSKNAEISLYFENDSIYHPSIDLTYDVAKNIIKLVKGEGSLGQSNFTDSYHKIDFSVDVITWDLNGKEL